MLRTLVSSLVLFTVLVPLQAYTPPRVTLDHATVTGLVSGSTHQFLGIPFAEPPFVNLWHGMIGNLRFRLPRKLPPYNTSFSATQYGPACPQQVSNGSASLNNTSTIPSAEDCLTLNVVTPSTATPDSRLPVLVWIYGGGFEFGGSSTYNSSLIMEKSISLGTPVIYVSMNYRVNAFGFIGGREVKSAGVSNLGLRDQRLALEWVHKYICEFGGDPAKVTIWGDSAGAMSAAYHMVINGGNIDGLFRAAIMHSGTTIPTEDITEGQPYYDALVAEAGCSGTTDTLQCLRGVPYETLLKAVNQSPGAFSSQGVLAWMPRVDGTFLKADPRRLVQQGSVASIPFIASDCDDEGTIFSFSSLNVTTDAEFEELVSTRLVPNASAAELAQLMKYYPSDPALGSPFDTGDKNALTPQFKRIAAFEGDFLFQAPRRFLMQSLSRRQNGWAYLYKRGKLTPNVGAAHGTDIHNMYTGGDILPYLLNFVKDLNPNGAGTDLYWPQYDAATNQTMLEFLDGSTPVALTTDTYRADATAYMTKVTLDHIW